tara:strand:+ start:7590 stop:7940 length:351 start_codon:yes stop_codon:yes gene_type:complete
MGFFSKAKENFNKKGGFGGLGEKFKDVGGRMAKVGGTIAKVGGFFDPRIAEVGDAIQTAGNVSQGIGGAVQNIPKLSDAVNKGDFQSAGQIAGELGGSGASIVQQIKDGSKLKYMG